jgi:1-deoxy-D-xylulose-5-phosphate reductoisomerase
MNKGLEVIEAHWLFGAPASKIDVVVHPQSIVHSIVELRDGSMIAQMGITDMRLPIQYAFSYPDRWDAPVPFLDLTRCGALEFHEPAWDDFPCLGLAYRALEAERSLPIVLNAANEVAVAAFLEGRIAFPAIARLIREVMDAHTPAPVETVTAIRKVDASARAEAAECVAKIADLKVRAT